ncbi:MAG: amidase [Herminiimonas sp.]|nr:amidase [Herminiimonas sp.]
MSPPGRLNELDATSLARLLQRREISAEQVLRACLDRIEAREPTVQAWTHLAPDLALAQARVLDRGAIRGLLHGLPIGVKDLFDTADMPTGYGSPIYSGHQPMADAAVVARCRAAGAIVLGKTVTTEFATFHPGKTHNPRRAGHTPGGSSSGSAAAVADCMVPLAFGTQTAASVIRPAAFCGVVGFKPSYGSSSRAGVKNLSESLDTIGVFGRSVADAALFAEVVTGDARLSLPDETAASPVLRIGLCRTFEWEYADADSVAALEQGTRRLAGAGVMLADCELPAMLSSALQLQIDIMAFEAAANLAAERLNHPTLLSAALITLFDAGIRISPAQHQANLVAAARARIAIDACFDEHDVLIAPSTIGVAPAGIDRSGDPVFCRMWTLLGLPCVHLPFATGANGLPVGLQVIGRFDRDAALLAAARWMHGQLQSDQKR